MKNFNATALSLAIATASLLLVSCEEEGLDEELPTVDIDSSILPTGQDIEAIAGASSGLDNLASAAAVPMASVSSNLDSVVDSMSSMSIMSDLFEEDTQDQSPLMQTMAISAKSKLAKAGNDDMEDLILALFDVQNASADLSTNTITVGVNSEEICDVDDDDYATCMDVISDVTLTIQVINSDAGVITVNYENYSPFQFSYAPEYLGVLVDLADLKSAATQVASISGDSADDIPETFEGQLALSISATQTNATFTAWIAQTITIGDGVSDVSLAATNNLATLALDSALNTAQITSNIGAINGQFTTEDDEDLSISFGGASVDVLVDGEAQTVTINNTGTVGNGLSISLDNAEMISAMLAPFSANYAESTQQLTITSAMELMVNLLGEFEDEEYDEQSMTTTLSEGDLGIELSVDIPASTVLDASQDDLVVDSGSVTVLLELDEIDACETTWADGDAFEDATPVCSTGSNVTTPIDETFTDGMTVMFEEEE